MAATPSQRGSWFDQNPLPPQYSAPVAAQPMPPGTAPAGPIGGAGGMFPNMPQQLGGPGAQTGPPTLNPSDPASRQAFISYYANQPGANPSLKNDPNYWDQKIASGELGSDSNYIVSKFMTPEGAPAGTIGSLGAGGFGNFQAPTGVDYMNDPGYQFRIDQGNKAIQASAAAKGTLLTGGTLKALAGYSQGLASNEYGNVFNRALAVNQNNFGQNNTIANLGYNATNASTA